MKLKQPKGEYKHSAWRHTRQGLRVQMDSYKAPNGGLSVYWNANHSVNYTGDGDVKVLFENLLLLIEKWLDNAIAEAITETQKTNTFGIFGVARQKN